VEEWLDSPPGQCSSAQCTIGSTISGKKKKRRRWWWSLCVIMLLTHQI
jgi:hypothetical protein